MIILQISPVNTKKKRNGAIRSGSLRTPASRVSLKQEKCVRQIKVCSSTVFECGFSWITARLTVKVRMESNLPVSPNANPPPAAQAVLSVWACVCPPLSTTHHHLVPFSSTSVYTLQCQHRPGAMATHAALRWEANRGLLLPLGFFLFLFFTTAFREKKKLLWKIFWSRVQQWERNMRLMWRASGRFMLLQVFKAGWQ